MTADPHTGISLAAGLEGADLTIDEVWQRYLGVGGDSTRDELRRHVQQELGLDDHEHNVIAQALNEAYLDRGRDHPVAYRHLHGYRS